MPPRRQRRSTGPVACGAGSTPPRVGPQRDDPCPPPGRGRPRFCTPPWRSVHNLLRETSRRGRGDRGCPQTPPPGGPVPQRPLVITSDAVVLDEVVRIGLTAGTEVDVATDAGAA